MHGDNFEISCREIARNGVLHPECVFQEGVVDRVTGFKQRGHLSFTKVISDVIENTTTATRIYEFRVDFHDSFKCPVLWLRPVRQLDSSLIPLEELFEDFPNSKQVLIDQRQQKISLEVHPILNTPWYLLHPCHTEKMLDTVVEEKEGVPENVRNKEKLIAWLNIYFQPFGLNLIQKPPL